MRWSCSSTRYASLRRCDPKRNALDFLLSADARHARQQLVFSVVFVLLWSTGFIAAKYGLPYAPPFAFLFYRFALVAALMVVVSLATGARWPGTVKEYRDLALVALCVHGLYLGGVFVSLDSGMA